jgi:hypothetical protein
VRRKSKLRRSLVSRLLKTYRSLVSNPLVFELGLGALIILTFAVYQEMPPGIWTFIRRILGRW